MADEILVTGTLDFASERHDEVAQALLPLVDATRAEEGNISYTFSADLAVPGRFHVVEQWESQDAMDAHMASAHMAAFMGAAGDLGIAGASVTGWYGAEGRKLM